MERFAGYVDRAAVAQLPLEDRIPFESVYGLFAHSAARAPDDAALLWLPNGRANDDLQTIRYREMFANITRTANLLHDHGIRAGQAVSILLPNLPETYYAMWGASAAGIANPVNPLLTPQQIAEIMAAGGSRVLIAGGRDKEFDTFEKAKAVRELYPALDTVIIVGEGDGTDSLIDFSQAIAQHPQDRLVSDRRFDRDDMSVYFHTGGTTGSPKLAQQTHWNQLFTAWSCAFMFDLSPSDRVLTGLPLFHANAAITTGLAGFFAGAATLLAGQRGYRDKAMLGDFWRIAARCRASVFSGVPTIYASLLETIDRSLDLSTLRFGLCGAAPMPVSLFRQFEKEAGVRILEAYGMTEGGAVSTANPRDGERRIGSIGIAMPYQDVRIARLDADGNYERDCDSDEVGVLLLSGPNLFPGYRQEERNAGIWPLPGWFNSGDLGRKDADGYYWLAGRAKDLIIRGGHNIDPAVIEEALHKHPAVELAASVGRPDTYAGEVPIAYVSLVPGAAVTEEELRDFARAHVPERPAAPAEVIIVPAIPVTAVGKIFKPTLRLDATRRAFVNALGGLATTRVEARNDDRLGIVTDIDCEPNLADDVRGRLAQFAIPFTINGKAP